jgi:hypothetical protein
MQGLGDVISSVSPLLVWVGFICRLMIPQWWLKWPPLQSLQKGLLF